MRLHVRPEGGFVDLRRQWLPLLGTLAAGLLFVYKLASLPVAGRLSNGEYQLANSGGDWHHLLNQPFWLPYRAVAWLSRQALTAHPTVALRLASVVWAVGALACLLYILRRWYGPRTALFGFFLLATSAAFLHIGRLATTDVTYLAALPLLLAAHVALQQAPTSKTLVIWLGCLAALAYIPGMVWFITIEIIWQRQYLAEAGQNIKHWSFQLLLVLLASLSLVPLAYGLFRHFSLAYLMTWLGMPSSMPSAIQLAKNAAAAIAFIVFRTPRDPSRWLGRLPLLGAFLLVCLLAGIIFYLRHVQSGRTRLLLVLGFVSLLLLTAGGPVNRSILVPLVYVVAMAGVAYVLHIWLELFPRNLTARYLGIVLISLAVGLTMAYNLRHYFIAWPHNTDTRAVFTFQAPQ